MKTQGVRIEATLLRRLAIAAATLSLAACGSTDAVDDAGREPTGTWLVHSLDGALIPVVEPPAATVHFEDDRSLAGTILCNRIRGVARWTEAGEFTRLEDSRIVTVVGCRDGKGEEIGQRFWDAMASARRWEIQGPEMVIHFADGSTATLKKID